MAAPLKDKRSADLEKLRLGRQGRIHGSGI